MCRFESLLQPKHVYALILYCALIQPTPSLCLFFQHAVQKPIADGQRGENLLEKRDNQAFYVRLNCIDLPHSTR